MLRWEGENNMLDNIELPRSFDGDAGNPLFLLIGLPTNSQEYIIKYIQ